MRSIFWHRRDLRIHDNAGLFKALKRSTSVQALFIFDSSILSKLQPSDKRVAFIYQEIERLKEAYRLLGSDLLVYYGDPKQLIPKIAAEMNAKAVFTNRDYEPYALERDSYIAEALHKQGISFTGSKDHVLFEKNEVLKADGTPYTVFTPYSRKWKELINPFYLSSYPVEKYTVNLSKGDPTPLLSLEEIGFEKAAPNAFPTREVVLEKIKKYSVQRDIPGIEGTSRLGIHLRFGTISIRELARTAQIHNETFLNELIWRDFYQMILVHFPHSVENAFKKQYDRIVWEYNEQQFKAWCEGKTGYPLVDAGMRELNATGFMHNRVRMVVASFLTKHLLHDWRLGEAYFAEKLFDFELGSNVGGWQWAAGCGCDAAPYFRVFNPTSQLEKFDKQLNYVKKWVPEYGTDTYVAPIIEHKFARERVLQRYKQALYE